MIHWKLQGLFFSVFVMSIFVKFFMVAVSGIAFCSASDISLKTSEPVNDLAALVPDESESDNKDDQETSKKLRNYKIMAKDDDQTLETKVKEDFTKTTQEDVLAQAAENYEEKQKKLKEQKEKLEKNKKNQEQKEKIESLPPKIIPEAGTVGTSFNRSNKRMKFPGGTDSDEN